MNPKFAIICILTMLGISSPLAGLCDPQDEIAVVEESSWKKEFERLCAETEIATTLPNQKIRDLIRDSDILLEKLESLQGSQTKVYVFRLKKCKMFFEFALQLNETG